MNISDWRAFTSILDMQISPERLLQSWICKLAHGGHVYYAYKLIFELNRDNLSESVYRKKIVEIEIGYILVTEERLRRPWINQ